MTIVHISAECYPAAKAGGLGDVVGALPKYQNRGKYRALVCMPHYHTPWLLKAKKLSSIPLLVIWALMSCPIMYMRLRNP